MEKSVLSLEEVLNASRRSFLPNQTLGGVGGQDGLQGGGAHSEVNCGDDCYGSWSSPRAPASPGQYGTEEEGRAAIQDWYASRTGKAYVADPSTMHLETEIDIGRQIQESMLNPKGYMYSVLRRALADPNGKAEFQWTGRRWAKSYFTPGGRSVGRFKGIPSGVLTVNKKTPTWTAKGSVEIASDIYDWALDGNPIENVGIWIGANTPNLRNWAPTEVRLGKGFLGRGVPTTMMLPQANKEGKGMPLSYNRIFLFTARGRY